MPKSRRTSTRPKTAATITVEIITTFTELITSSLLGHITFRNSAYDSLMNWTIFFIISPSRRSRLRTHDLRFWRPPLYQLSYTPFYQLSHSQDQISIEEASILLDFCLFVERMLPIKGTIFLKFQFFLDIPAVFTGSIVAPLALAALQSYQFNHCLFACHKLPLPSIKISKIRCGSCAIPHGKHKNQDQNLCKFWSALDQNRTDDLILTMDMLCQLSYKGRFPKSSVFGDTSANLHSLEKIQKITNLVKVV